MKEAMEAFLAQFDTNGEDRDQMTDDRGRNVLTI